MKVYTKDNNGDPGNIFLPQFLQEWTTAFTSKARFKNEMFLNFSEEQEFFIIPGCSH